MQSSTITTSASTDHVAHSAMTIPMVPTGTPSVLPIIYFHSTPSNNAKMNSVKISNIVDSVAATNGNPNASIQLIGNSVHATASGGSVFLTPAQAKTCAQIVATPTALPSAANITNAVLTMIQPLGSMLNGGELPATCSSNLMPLSRAILAKSTATSRLQAKYSLLPFDIATNGSDNMETLNNLRSSHQHIQTAKIEDSLNCSLNSAPTDKEYELSIEDPSECASTQINAQDFMDFSVSTKVSVVSDVSSHQVLPVKIECPTNEGQMLTEGEQREVQSVHLQQKPAERRRKSTISYLKDYDDMEIIDDTITLDKIRKPLDNSETTLTKTIKTKEGFCNSKAEIEDNIITEPNTEDLDLSKILKWDHEGIGTLPGSRDIKFFMNEFNLLEFVHATSVKISKRDDSEEIRCMQCGCFGLPDEFVDQFYCSLDCRETHRKSIQHQYQQLKEQQISTNGKSRKRKRTCVRRCNTNDSNPSSDIEDNGSAENSQDKCYNKPWACKKKGFSWTKYLDHIKAKSAPVKLFKDPFPYNRNGFRPAMKLEGIDPQHPAHFCVLTVAEVCGYRMRLHFDGYPDNYDFWVNADSMDIFPIGWCEKHGHILQPPPNYTVNTFSWLSYLKQTKSVAAPKHLFGNRAGNVVCPNGFRVGMKLEAVDRKDTSLVCVATVRDMMDNRILVHFDSWDDIYDYWVDPTSPYIHPVGWCDQEGHRLTPPNDYPNKEMFSWPKYLKETKSVAAPVRAFKVRPTCGFKRGMRLECVDKRVPRLVRVATVNEVKAHRLRIQFDGWPERYSFWVDDDCEDIHPAGWCHKTGHPIETPLTSSDIYDFLECPTIGCRGIGHIEGAKHSTHNDVKFCPYAEQNIDKIEERYIPDRLLTPDRTLEVVVPVTIDPKEVKTKPRLGRPPKNRNINPPSDLNTSKSSTESTVSAKVSSSFEETVKTDVEAVKTPLSCHSNRRSKYKKSGSYSARSNSEEDEEIDKNTTKGSTIYNEVVIKEEPKAENEYRLQLPYDVSALKSILDEPKVEPAERLTWDIHTKFLRDIIEKEDVKMNSWSEIDVCRFVKTIPGLDNVNTLTHRIKRFEINGEAFLSLTQRDIIEKLKVKIGPAIKLYNSIVLLRQRRPLKEQEAPKNAV